MPLAAVPGAIDLRYHWRIPPTDGEELGRNQDMIEHSIRGWGGHAAPGRELLSEDFEGASADQALSRGLGRSYGDASLPAPGCQWVVGSRLADRLLSFDEESGWLRAEAGLSLGELHRIFLPRGWVSPVHTGTQFVTLGGMVASDVHGKNHHLEGTIGRHVRRLRLRVADGRVLWCSREEYADLFLATLGGMGLTGHILEVELRLQAVPSPWIYGERERIPNLDVFLDSLRAAAADWPHTVGWIDCLSRGRHLGRGILMRGRWAEPGEAPKEPPAQKRRVSIPFHFPPGALNPWTVRLFNACYYRRQWRRVSRGIEHPETFFHPLDAVRAWNRIYGRRGFTQYQCVLPQEGGADAVRRFLGLLTSFGAASFLSVIKDCGAEGEGMLSFPRPGISIALDLPMRMSTQGWVDQLNECVVAEGGRIYLSKDSLTRVEHFQAMEGRLESWGRVVEEWDPEGKIGSALGHRLLGRSPRSK